MDCDPKGQAPNCDALIRSIGLAGLMFRAKGAATLQPRATPWDSVATKSAPPCRGEIRRTPHVPIEYPRGANGSTALMVVVSIPHIPFVIRDLISFQELSELLLKRHLAMVALLVLDVANHGVGLRFADGERAVACLP